jgi:hypothetical protein
LADNEHDGSDNLICFNFVVDLHDNHDPEAWNRILDAFIEAVEKEGACAGGGIHPTGSSLDWCTGCQDFEDDDDGEL